MENKSPSASLSIVLCYLLISVTQGAIAVESVTFYVTNKCKFPIWPGTASNTGHPLVAEGGFFLASGQTKKVQAEPSWKGRIWARTSCNFTKGTLPACETGDCNGKLACNGSIGLPPATLVQFSLEPDRTKPSFYDISLVDGHNLPIAVSPIKARDQVSNCTIEGCLTSLTSGSACPQELQVVNSQDEVVACKSACLAFNLDVFCCRNDYGTAEKCKPTLYSKVFKDACPSYFSYAFDTPLPLHSCWSNEYAITFCPSQWARDAYEI